MTDVDVANPDGTSISAPNPINNRYDLQRVYLKDVHRYVASLISDSSDVDDVCMEVFHSAFRRFWSVKRRDDPRVWLIAIARHKVADYRRRQYRRREVSLDQASEVAVAGPSISNLHVHSVLGAMPAIESEALVLKYVMGLSQEEIAVVLWKSKAAVNSILQRARIRFIELENGDQE